MSEIEIGRAKRARRAYSFDDVAIVPSRRTRDPEEVSVAWQIDAYRFELPVLAAPMDSVMSPETAIAFGRAGGLGVLDLEGLWTRYDDPSPLLEEVASLPAAEAPRRMQEIYRESIKPGLITERLAQMRDPNKAHLVSPDQVQGDLFAPIPRPRSRELMGVLDRVNREMGRGTLSLARVPQTAGWAMRQSMKSPGYVSSWEELARSV